MYFNFNLSWNLKHISMKWILLNFLLGFIQNSKSEIFHHNLPDNLEIIDPKSLGLSATDLDKFLGNVKILPLDGNAPTGGNEDGGSSSKTQILTVGFDGSENLNLQDFESLTTSGLPEADREVAEMAFKKFQNYFQNNNNNNNKNTEDLHSSGRTFSPSSTEYRNLITSNYDTTPNSVTVNIDGRNMTKVRKRVKLHKRPIFSSTFRSAPIDSHNWAPSTEYSVATTTTPRYDHRVNKYQVPLTQTPNVNRHQHKNLQNLHHNYQTHQQHRDISNQQQFMHEYNNALNIPNIAHMSQEVLAHNSPLFADPGRNLNFPNYNNFQEPIWNGNPIVPTTPRYFPSQSQRIVLKEANPYALRMSEQYQNERNPNLANQNHHPLINQNQQPHIVHQMHQNQNHQRNQMQHPIAVGPNHQFHENTNPPQPTHRDFRQHQLVGNSLPEVGIPLKNQQIAVMNYPAQGNNPQYFPQDFQRNTNQLQFNTQSQAKIPQQLSPSFQPPKLQGPVPVSFSPKNFQSPVSFDQQNNHQFSNQNFGMPERINNNVIRPSQIDPLLQSKNQGLEQIRSISTNPLEIMQVPHSQHYSISINSNPPNEGPHVARPPIHQVGGNAFQVPAQFPPQTPNKYSNNQENRFAESPARPIENIQNQNPPISNGFQHNQPSFPQEFQQPKPIFSHGAQQHSIPSQGGQQSGGSQVQNGFQLRPDNANVPQPQVPSFQRPPSTNQIQLTELKQSDFRNGGRGLFKQNNNPPQSNAQQFPATQLQQFSATQVQQFPTTQLQQFPATQVQQFPATQVQQFPAKQLQQFPAKQLQQFPTTQRPLSMSGLIQITPSTPLIPISTVENAIAAQNTRLQLLHEVRQGKASNELTRYQGSTPNRPNNQPVNVAAASTPLLILSPPHELNIQEVASPSFSQQIQTSHPQLEQIPPPQKPLEIAPHIMAAPPSPKVPLPQLPIPWRQGPPIHPVHHATSNMPDKIRPGTNSNGRPPFFNFRILRHEHHRRPLPHSPHAPHPLGHQPPHPQMYFHKDQGPRLPNLNNIHNQGFSKNPNFLQRTQLLRSINFPG